MFVHVTTAINEVRCVCMCSVRGMGICVGVVLCVFVSIVAAGVLG